MSATKGGMLTDRQRQVLSLISHGFSNREIAERLVVQESTVKAHIVLLLKALGAYDRAHAVRIAFEDGLLVKAQQRRVRPARPARGAS